MARDIIYQNCPSCGEVQPYNTHKINHTLHLLLSVFTFGLWLIVWILIGLAPKSAPKCAGCGQSLAKAGRSAKREFKRDRKEEREALEAALPYRGQRVKVVEGPHKGKFGTASHINGDSITIADKRNRTITIELGAVRNVI